jgi:hypothetical protein
MKKKFTTKAILMIVLSALCLLVAIYVLMNFSWS